MITFQKKKENNKMTKIKQREERFYTCRFDRPFKEVFLKKNNEDLLKKLLEKILKETIVHIEYKPTELNTGNIKIKKTLDALVTTEKRVIGIEINSDDKNYVHPRNMAYISDVYASQTLVGDNYTEEIEIVQINFTYGLKDEKAYRVYYVQDEEGRKFVKNFKIYEINMDYYKQMWNNKDIEGIEENKYLVMLDLELEDLKELSKGDKVVQKYMKELGKINEIVEFREYMSKEEDDRKIRNTIIKEGREEGLKKGLEQGIKQGILMTAKNMIENGMPLEDISKVTNLSIEELKKI